MVRAHIARLSADADAQKVATQLQISRCEARLAALTDALLDGILGKSDFETRKRRLLEERQFLHERLGELAGRSSLELLLEKFELQNPLILGFESEFPGDQREALDIAVSNWTVRPENQTITLHSPYQELADAAMSNDCGPYRHGVRTFVEEIFEVLKCVANDTSAPIVPKQSP